MIADNGDGVADIDEDSVDTNLVFVRLRSDVISTGDFIQRMEQVYLNRKIDRLYLLAVHFSERCPPLKRIGYR